MRRSRNPLCADAAVVIDPNREAIGQYLKSQPALLRKKRQSSRQPRRIGQPWQWLSGRLRCSAPTDAGTLRRTQGPLKHVERLLFTPLHQFGFGKAQIYRGRVFAPSRSVRFGSQGRQVFLGQAQRRVKSLLRLACMMTAELHFAQGGIENLREIVVGKLPDFILDPSQTGQSGIEGTLTRLRLSRHDLALEAVGPSGLGPRNQSIEPGGFSIPMFGYLGLLGPVRRLRQIAMDPGPQEQIFVGIDQGRSFTPERQLQI